MSPEFQTHHARYLSCSSSVSFVLDRCQVVQRGTLPSARNWYSRRTPGEAVPAVAADDGFVGRDIHRPRLADASDGGTD